MLSSIKAQTDSTASSIRASSNSVFNKMLSPNRQNSSRRESSSSPGSRSSFVVGSGLGSIRKGSAADIKNFLRNSRGGRAMMMPKVSSAGANGENGEHDDEEVTQSGDRMATTQTEALMMLQEMIHEAKKVEERKHVRESGPVALAKNKWDLPWTPLKELDATVNDVLIAFCKWAKVEMEYDPNGSTTSLTTTYVINVSKAFRRLETYTTWMKDNRKTLEEPLTVDSISEAAKAFGLRQTHDKQERLVWWIDMNQLDMDALGKTIPPVDSVRFLVWLSHVSMFDKRAQENGIIIIQNLAKISFWKLASVFPNDVRNQLSRMTIGCLPIKMKKIYIMDAATWTNVMMNMMKPFMSKKVRARVIVIGKKDNAQQVVSNIVGGYENILTNFSGLSGTQEKDIIFGTFVGSMR